MSPLDAPAFWLHFGWSASQGLDRWPEIKRRSQCQRCPPRPQAGVQGNRQDRQRMARQATDELTKVAAQFLLTARSGGITWCAQSGGSAGLRCGPQLPTSCESVHGQWPTPSLRARGQQKCGSFAGAARSITPTVPEGSAFLRGVGPSSIMERSVCSTSLPLLSENLRLRFMTIV